MGMSNTDKQRRYRERALKDPDGLLLTRLQVMLSPTADATLKRICERTGKTKREIGTVQPVTLLFIHANHELLLLKLLF